MSRTRIELQSNDNIANEKIIQEILTSNNYKQVVKSDETYWKCGLGILTAPKCIKYTFQDDKIIMEAWVKNFGIKESDLSGAFGFVPKDSCKKVLNEIATKINTQS